MKRTLIKINNSLTKITEAILKQHNFIGQRERQLTYIITYIFAGYTHELLYISNNFHDP